MPYNKYKDMYCCMHFVDDLRFDIDSKCNEYFSDQNVEGTNTIATHQTKFGIVEDGFNSQW